MTTIPDTIEGWPALSTGAIAVTADGTVYTYQPNVPGGLAPAVTPPPDDIEGYPAFATMGVGIDADGGLWQLAPLEPGGVIPPAEPIPPPENTVAPLIQILSGNPTPGQQAVNSNAGTWVPPQTQGYTRQWYSAGAAISGATAIQYAIQESDVGNVITCGVIAIGDGGASEEAMSNGLTVVPADDPIDEPETRAQRSQQPQAKAHKTSKRGKTHHAGSVHRRSSGASKR